MPYLISTYLLFFFGPYAWPVRAWWVIIIYVPAAFLALTGGFLFGVNRQPAGGDFRATPLIYWIGAVGALLLLTPTALTYTGKAPWNIGQALSDQRAAYSALQEQLKDTETTRAPLALLRGLIGPFTFSVLPILITTWRPKSTWWKVAGILTVLASVDLSILRGTTRELADIAVVGSSALLVRTAIVARHAGRDLAAALLGRWKSILLVLMAVIITLTALVGRTQARLGGDTAGCIGQSGVCADLNSGIYGRMNDTYAFGSAMISAYLSQGYYGLSLAGEKPFESTMGIGHSPPLAAWAVKFGLDPSYYQRSYTARADNDGWSDENQWSTLMAWIANDVSLPGAIVFVTVLGIAWGSSWNDAVRGGDIRATVFFCVCMMMVFYLPANNQMMSTLENYLALLFWGFSWLYGRSRRALA